MNSARHPSLLLVGGSKLDKFSFVQRVILKTVCERKASITSDSLEPYCGTCGSCFRILKGSSEVLTILSPEQGQIKIERVREVLKGMMFQSLREAQGFVIEEAEKLHPAAANALLKTIEEPPEKTTVFLCSDFPQQLMPTIRSRLLLVRCGSLRRDPFSRICEERAETREQVISSFLNLCDEFWERQQSSNLGLSWDRETCLLFLKGMQLVIREAMIKEKSVPELISEVKRWENRSLSDLSETWQLVFNLHSDISNYVDRKTAMDLFMIGSRGE